MAFYLEELTVRLATGVGQFPRKDRRQLADFLLTAQQPDGGFSGREGASDIYYTSFALRSLAILGELHGDRAAHCAGYLQQQLQGQVANVDFFSLLYAAALLESASGIDIYEGADPGWPDRVSDQLQLLRRDDGGYAKAAEGMASSTYHSFLVLLCQQLVKRPLSEPERLVEFLLSQQAEEGGFHEIRASKRAGTNPTAAAIAALRILDALDEETRGRTAHFLAGMQTDEGGLRANTRIPIADLLSTFTGLLTLGDLGALEMIDDAAALRYARSLQQPGGGFFGAAWDEQADVEYTFYGIGTCALLAAAQHDR
jgi:geranylgeranyl transferase type-2 subunit beta